MITEQDQSTIGNEHQPALQPLPGATVALHPLPLSAPDEVFLHIDLVRSLFQHRWLAIGVICAGIFSALGYVVKVGPIYSAQSQVYIQPAPPRLMQTSGANIWPSDANTYESYIQQQIQNMGRSDVLLLALKKMPAGTWQQSHETEQQAVERLGRAIGVTRLGTSYQVSIVSRADTPALAALISNAVASAFIDIESRELRAGDPQRIELLREERDRIQKALVEDREEQESLNSQLGVAEVIAASSNPYDEQIREVREELVKARTASDQASARLTAVAGGKSLSSTALDAEAEEIVAGDAGLVSMKKSLNERRAVLITRMANLTPSHPQYKQDAEELQKINASLGSMVEELRGSVARTIEQRLKNDLERTSTVEARLNAQLGQLTGAARGASPRLQRSEELVTDIKRLQNRYTAVDEQFRNLTLESKAPGAAYISAVASPPLHAASGPVLRKALMLFLGSLVLAVVVAVAAQNLDPRIYIAADVERVIGCSPMAQLPDFLQVSNGVGEEYMLRLAGAIEYSYQHRGLKSCIFTGVASGSGVTTLITRVRTMLEEIGRSTVLVDASGSPPFDSASADDAGNTGLVTTQNEIRPSALLQQMADEMDSDAIVLTDAAPLLASGETEYLARFVDSAIVIIQSGLTTRAQLREVAQTLQRLQVSAVGFVLNRVAIEKANTSFRQSIRAVENRLRIQNRSHARRSARSRTAAQPEPQSSQEPFFVPTKEPVRPSAAVPASDPSPQPVASVPPEATKPARAASRVTEPSPDAVPAVPASHTARGRGEPSRAAQTVASVRMATEFSAEEAGSPSMPAPVASVAEPPAPVATPAPAPPVARAAEVHVPSPAPPPAAMPAINVAPPPHPDDPGAEEPEYHPASRLGGLRNLLVSLGRKSLNKIPEANLDENELEPRFERATVRPVYSERYSSTAERETAEPGSIPMRVTAQPEFLPPKQIVEVEKEKEPVRPAPPAARWENSDEPQTLPSVRGQYRKKRYPPI